MRHVYLLFSLTTVKKNGKNIRRWCLDSTNGENSHFVDNSIAAKDEERTAEKAEENAEENTEEKSGEKPTAKHDLGSIEIEDQNPSKSIKLVSKLDFVVTTVITDEGSTKRWFVPRYSTPTQNCFFTDCGHGKGKKRKRPRKNKYHEGDCALAESDYIYAYKSLALQRLEYIGSPETQPYDLEYFSFGNNIPS
ncbi:hypothetical protein H072_8652 [Dactylellina haptotyla CBS 200.50]|uniref:Uncharacterized protein n=1 Tax=Dactylellina haptotyla (strain CBS 200.50) TaxID=1284197 RepID=S8A3M8_DACHA|nr:hypothetical protein H072_8652 [Dactylellina haptotyla CBS 200.50]